jgi:aminobenzoyl-glutamate transport protein
MSEAVAPAEAGESRGFTQKMLDGIEKAGNKVPHPVMMFIYLIALVMVLSVILDALNVSVTEEILVPEPEVVIPEYIEAGSTEPAGIEVEDYDTQFTLEEIEVPVRSLLTVDGLRFIFTSFVNNFANFSVVAVIFVAMIGVGVAEEAGLMGALIRKLVAAAPGSLLTFFIILIGGLSSVATDAGYLILIPLGAAAFLSVNRHPLAGIAAAYAGVSAAFSVNILIAPLDALLTEMTNEAIALVNPDESLTITANLYFSIVSTLLMAVVMTFITARIIEPRLGTYVPEAAAVGEDGIPVVDAAPEAAVVDPEAESRGMRYALFAILGAVVAIVILTAPSGAPLRDPETDAIIGDTPFMSSLIFLITLIFLAAGIGYGIGARTIKSSTDVINGITKTFASLSGLIFMLLIISQFIAFFNYTAMPRVIAGGLAHLLEKADVNEVLLLVAFILVIALLDIIIPGSLPKWAIFAPIFVPLFINLGVSPQTVLAAYRVGDSPMNVITPLMVYLPFIIIVAQRYQKNTGIGTIISLMIPYTLIVLLIWIVFFVLWYVLGIPLGPGYPVEI